MVDMQLNITNYTWNYVIIIRQEYVYSCCCAIYLYSREKVDILHLRAKTTTQKYIYKCTMNAIS